MIKEYWDFLLSLRNSLSDPSIVEAILFGSLVILEITEPRHVAEYFPKQVVETQAWTAGKSPRFQRRLIVDIFERLDEDKGKLLAGGILLKTRDIVEKYERLLLGDMISFGSIAGTPLGLNLR
jgi:telomere length regulation protein